MTKDEELSTATDVWAFDFRYLWLTITALIILYFLPISTYPKIALLIVILWYGGYSFRQKWRLSLTNKRVIARRLYPRPLSYLLTKIHNFPYRHLEGMSTGPRNNVALFLLGLFLGVSLGINILKSSLYADQFELPDTLEFIIFLMVLLPPFRNQGQQLQLEFEAWYRQFAQDLLISVGTIALIIVWIGGSILASLKTFNKMWVTRKE